MESITSGAHQQSLRGALRTSGKTALGAGAGAFFKAYGPSGGDGSITRLVYGSSTAESSGNQLRVTNRILGGASILTVFHEEGHALLAHAEQRGILTQHDHLSILRAVEKIFDGRTTREGGGRLSLLPENFDTLSAADRKVAVHEGIVELLESDIIRTRKNTGLRQLPPGLISQNLAAISRIVGERTTGRFRAFLHAFRQSFGLAVDRAREIQRGLDNGTLDRAHLDGYLNKLVHGDPAGAEVRTGARADSVPVPAAGIPVAAPAPPEVPQAVLGKMPPIYLHVMEATRGGMTPPQIAEKLGISEKGVGNILREIHSAAARISNATNSAPENNHVVGERHGKLIVKRNNAKSESERNILDQKIADQIFAKVDGMCDKPRDRWKRRKSTSSHHSILKAPELTLAKPESLAIKSPHEILTLYSPDGRLNRAKHGTADSSEVPMDTPEGTTISHNHPKGKGPSDSDLRAILLNPKRIFRISGINEHGKVEIFQLEANKLLPKAEIVAITKRYSMACESYGDTHEARRYALRLTLAELGDTVSFKTRILP